MEDQHKTKEQLIEELRTHQMELEVQNEDLLRLQKDLELARDLYSDLYEFLPVGYVIVSDKGLILRANLTAASLLGVERSRLLSSGFSRYILNDDHEIFYTSRSKVLKSSDKGTCDVRMVKKDGTWFHARLEITVIAPDQMQSGQLRIAIIDTTELRQSQSELQGEKDKLKSILDNMNDGVYMVNSQYEIEYVNPVLESNFGMVDGRKCYTYFHDRTEPCPWCVNQRVFAGESVQWEWYSEKTGRTYELFDTPARHSDGSVSKLEIFHDITDRKRAEEKEKQASATLHVALESMTDAVFISDIEGNFIVLNEAFATFHKFRTKQECAKTLAEYPAFLDVFMPNGELAPLEQWAVPRALRGETATNAEYTLRRKDTGETWIGSYCFAPIRDQNGVIVGSVVSGRDITDQKAAQEALYASQGFLEEIVENIPDMIFVKDAADLRFVRLNKAGERLLGLARDELLGKSDYDLFPHEQADFFTKIDRAVLKAGGVLDIPEEEVDTKHQGKRIVHTKKIPVNNSRGIPQYLLGISEDITDRKKAQAEQDALRAQLFQSQKLEAVGTLAGGIAHDFNNILQVVLGYSELLLAGRGETDKDYAELDRINSSSRRGADLVHNLMMFSRKVEPSLKPLNLNEEVVQIQKLLSRTIPKDIKINLNLSGDLELVNADISQIGQVLMNLAVNARDAMPNGGVLNFGTTNVELDEAYCATHPGFEPRKYVLLAVSDTGVGMSKETLAHIFEPFFTTKEAGKGTGLGLATVFGIVKQHQGHITCYSEAGHGATFKIYLPAIEQTGEAETLENITAIVGGTETILLVDDEEYLRDLGATILKRYGYEVLTAGNGKEALGIYRTNHEKISLVILDLIMPEMDGKKCLVELLNINPKAKVLIASGHSEGILARETSLPGAKGLVAKPYEMKKLLNAVRDVLDAVG